MKKVIFSLVFFCGLALLSTSCNKDNDTPVTPEVQTGSMTIGTNTMDLEVARAVNYGQKNAIVLASDEMTDNDNDGIAIIFNGDIVPGTYTIGDDSKGVVPQVVGLHEFNMGELPFIMGADTLFFGDTYFWVNGQLSITENNGTWKVTREGVAPTEEEPDLSVSERALGQLIAGAVSLREALCREDTIVYRNREMLERVFIRKPILVEDHF